MLQQEIDNLKSQLGNRTADKERLEGDLVTLRSKSKRDLETEKSKSTGLQRDLTAAQDEVAVQCRTRIYDVFEIFEILDFGTSIYDVFRGVFLCLRKFI